MPYIYVLCESDGETPRYIGKANNPQDRSERHVRQAINGVDSYKCRWIRKLIKLGQGFVTVVLEQVTEEKWPERESYWIAHYRALGHKVCNATDGGEGLKNPSKRVRKKMSDSQKKLWRDPEHREKQTKIRKKRFENLEQRKKMSASQKKLWEDSEFRERMSEILRKRWKDPEYIKKQSEAHKADNLKEETRKRMSESHKGDKNHLYGKKQSEETKRKIAESVKAYKQKQRNKKEEG